MGFYGCQCSFKIKLQILSNDLARDLSLSDDLATELPALTKSGNSSNPEFQKERATPPGVARAFPLRVERCLAYPPHQSSHRVTAAI
jgi:hypothetical protein